MDYIAILQTHNLKVTPQRLEIVDILNNNGHINIDDLYILNQAQSLSHYSLDKSSIIFNGIYPKCTDKIGEINNEV